MTISELFAETRLLCDADSDSYSDTDLLRRINTAFETIAGEIFVSDGTWQYDDSNYTDLPIATANMVASQSDYSFSASHLVIERVEVLDNAGLWHKLEPIDKSQIDVAVSEFYKNPARPEFYDKQGASIFLYPAPSATYTTLTSGLKVYFQRTIQAFNTADVALGSPAPGFASPYHSVLAYMAAIPYCMSYKQDRVALYEKRVDGLKRDIIRFYSKRQKDARDVMSMKSANYI